MIQISNIYKSYLTNNTTTNVLKNVSLNVQKGEFIALMGSSGSGKSTLLNLIGLLDYFDKGELIINKQVCNSLNETERALFRNKNMGFVFQSFHLIPTKSVIKNVELALYYKRIPQKERSKLAIEALQKVGLGDKLNQKPNELSGGQKQRVAIARAIVTNPSILFADEPTGALDSKTSHEIMQLIKEIHQMEKTIVMITHDVEIANFADKIIHIKDGQIVS
ncbi:ABC transporter ATP-binding protein [Flammeovirga pacifica]|uniref:Macrolide ABC transporter ATP-binding protein n=1 Tax=Flammeovirga pacifica TaxID=915059 RepID=A0A1S1Z1R7_FLAPC|nr:ABC transporter ATP-binding protein [Flammeovirga pacifica]OHX67123.1 macrolide ABC transporter ATP-binding protein [Flammeovirga pacifica]